MMKKITEEMGIHKEWYEEALDVELKDLDQFIEKLNNFEHSYGTVCHATAAAAVATARGMAKKHGLTNFQAGFILWGFITNWSYRDNKCGMKIVNYDEFLYPQYEEKFQKTMSKEIFEDLQKEAAEMLKNEIHLARAVADYLKSIVDGKAPFGYEIRKED